MIGACPAEADRDGAGTGVVHRLAGWLGLAATPVFAGMALLAALPGGGPMDAMCASGPGAAWQGMLPMYLLMAAFHASPWLRLAAGAGRTATQP